MDWKYEIWNGMEQKQTRNGMEHPGMVAWNGMEWKYGMEWNRRRLVVMEWNTLEW